MWWLFQVLIMTLIIGSNGAYHWAGPNSGFAVMVLLAAFAVSWLSVWLNDLLLSVFSRTLTPMGLLLRLSSEPRGYGPRRVSKVTM
jgi:hypothetical protein